jgi:hypothetical protein
MKRAAFFMAAWAAMTIMAPAQAEPPKPGPEQKKLEVMTGSWSIDGDIKPNPMGPGGKMSETEKCDWMDGGFFLVCHVEFKSATMGSGTGMSVIGYSNDDKNYTYREFNSWGETMDSKGTVDGDTWTWTSDEKMGGKVMKGRFTMKFTSPTAYSFAYELSEDGTKWSTIVEGKATKNK